MGKHKGGFRKEGDLWVPKVTTKRHGADAMQKRVGELVNELREAKEPDAAVVLVAQLFAEATEWLEREGGESPAYYAVWKPGFIAAFDALESVKRHLDADPSRKLENEEHFRKMYGVAQELLAECEAAAPPEEEARVRTRVLH